MGTAGATGATSSAGTVAGAAAGAAAGAVAGTAGVPDVRCKKACLDRFLFSGLARATCGVGGMIGAVREEVGGGCAGLAPD